MSLRIEVDAREVLGFLNSLSRQAPFAVKSALNALMEHGQREVQAQLHNDFTLRHATFIERTVKTRKFATKTSLVAEIGIDPARDFLSKFEEGGRKTPLRGSTLAIPIAVRRNKSDIVIRSMRVRELQLRAHRTAKGAVQLKGLKRTFAIKGPTGGAILQRVGRKPKGTSLTAEISAGSVRVAYAFNRSVPIPASLHFYSTFARDAESWPRLMEAAWSQALRTAR